MTQDSCPHLFPRLRPLQRFPGAVDGGDEALQRVEGLLRIVPVEVHCLRLPHQGQQLQRLTPDPHTCMSFKLVLVTCFITRFRFYVVAGYCCAGIATNALLLIRIPAGGLTNFGKYFRFH